jgi:hypothetical protein
MPESQSGPGGKKKIVVEKNRKLSEKRVGKKKLFIEEHANYYRIEPTSCNKIPKILHTVASQLVRAKII